jgi:hypothetical protein
VLLTLHYSKTATKKGIRKAGTDVDIVFNKFMSPAKETIKNGKKNYPYGITQRSHDPRIIQIYDLMSKIIIRI